MNNRLFSIREAANILGVSTKTLRRWDQQGRLVAIRTVGNQRRYTQQQIAELKAKLPTSSRSAGLRGASKNIPAEVPSLFSETEAPREIKATHALPSALSGLPSGSFLKNHFLLGHKAGFRTVPDKGEISGSIESKESQFRRDAGLAKPLEPASLARRPLARLRLARLDLFKVGFVFASLVLILSLGGAFVLTKYNIVEGLPSLVAGLTEKKDQFVKFLANLPQISLEFKSKESLAPQSSESEAESFVPPDLVGSVLAAAAEGSDLALNINIPTFFSQNIGIGTAAPDTSAILDLASEEKGILPPRMTDAQIQAIPTPAAGLFVYNTTTNHYNMYNGTSWQGVFSSIGDSTTGEAFTEKGTSGTALYFYDTDGRGKLTIANLSGVRTYTLPDASGEVSLLGQTISNSELVNSKVTVSAGTNLTGGGEVALGSSVTLTLKDSVALGGTLTVSGASTLTGAAALSSTLTVAGALTLNGNVTLGDAAADTITFTGRVAQDANLIPIGTTGTNDLGSSALPWDNVYVNTVIADGKVVGWLQRNSGALSQANITDDLLLGATSTSSAKIAFINIAGGTPTATISANLGNNATTLTGTGILGTTNMQTLTLGNSSTGNIVIDSGSSAITLSDDTTISGDLAVNGGTSADITSTTTTGTLFNATVTTLSLGGAATTLNLGTTDSVTRTINLGTGTGADTINIGTGATTANTVNIGTGAVANTIAIGNTTGATAVNINVGTGNLALNGVTNSTYTIGAATTTGTITIGGTAETGDLTLGSSSGTNNVLIANGSGASTVNIANVQVAGAVNIGAAMTTGTITIGGTGLQTGTISLGTGTGAQTINLATGGTGAKTVTLGSQASSSSLTLDSGTGAINLGTTIAKTITIGNATGATAVNINVGTGNFALNGVAGSTYAIGAATTTGTIAIGGTAETGDLTLGSSSGTNNVLIANGSGASTVNIANVQVAGAVNIGAAMTTGTITIGGTGLQTGTIGLGTGTGAQTINLATGGTGAKTVTLGSQASSSSLTLDSGTGAINLGTTIAKTITIGNGTGATALALTSGTGAQTFTSSVATGITTSSAFVMNGSALTSGTALYLTSSITSGRLLDLNATNTTGTIVNLAYGAATTQGAGALTGLSLNVNTNVTVPAAGQNVSGITLQLPAASTTSNAAVYAGFELSAAGAVTNATAGSFAWRGTNIVLPVITQSAGGSVTASGVRVLVPASGAIVTAGTMNAIDVIAPTTTGPAAGTLVGVNIGALTSAGAATEYAIQIGAGWDRGVSLGANSIVGTTGIIDYTNFDVDANGNITVATSQGIDTNAAGELRVGYTTATTVAIGTTAATTINIGAGGALARAIAIGTGTGADTITIGTGGTGADTITIGNNASTTSLAFTSGTGSQTYTSSVATGTTTTSAFVFADTALTSGTLIYATSSSLTSGILANLTLTGSSVVATAANSGSLFTLTSTTTGFTGATQRLAAIFSSGANSNASAVVQGLAISVTNTGTTSTNVGLYATASGATNNYAAIFDAGNVGIGTTSPAGNLHIAGARTAAAWGVAGIEFQSAAATFTDSSTAASGTATNAVANSFAQPTFAASNTAVTITNGATLYVANSPANGTNVTVTNPYALWVDAGTTRIDSTSIVLATDGTPTISGAASVSGAWTFTGGVTLNSTFSLIGANRFLMPNNAFIEWADSGGTNRQIIGVNASNQVVIKRGDASGDVITISTNLVGIGTTAPSTLLHVGLAGTTLGTIGVAGNTSGLVTIRPAAAAGTWTLTLPTAVGTAGQQLTDAAGDGITSWAAAGSKREYKNILGTVEPKEALLAILGTPVYRFTYKPGFGTGDYNTKYVGVVAEEAPWAVHFNGTIINPVNTLGYAVLGIQALALQGETLQAQIASSSAAIASLTNVLSVNSGNLGIGTAAPSFKLDVTDMQIASPVAQIFNTGTGTASAALALKLGNTSTTAVASTNSFINFETAGIGIVGSISGNGAKGVTYATSGVADFAEYFRKDPNQNVEFGSVMCLNESGFAVLCSLLNSKILGIASERPAFLGGENLGAGSIAVGLVGQVETLVSSANGEILPGDALTASDIPGVAIKATKPGQIVGKALESFDGSSCHAEFISASSTEILKQVQDDNGKCLGKILVSVNVGWYDPLIYIASDGTLANTTNTTNTANNSIEISDQTSNSHPEQSRRTAFNSQLAEDSLFKDLNKKVSALEAKLDLLNLQFEQQASTSGLLASQGDALRGWEASSSAALALGDLELNSAAIADNLMVLGRTTVTDLGVTGNINAGLLAIHGLDGSINTLAGDLRLQSNGLNGIDILNGKIVMDTKGNLTVVGTITAKQIEAENYTVLGQESIGSGTIPAGSTSIEVATSIATGSSKIFLTTTSITDKQITVVEKSDGRFKVAIPQPTTSPISFDWWIVGNR